MMEIVSTEPPSLTGQQLLDEPFLRDRGWTDERLDAYWLEGKPPTIRSTSTGARVPRCNSDRSGSTRMIDP